MHEDVNEFENALRSLTPAAKTINAIAAAFDAGKTEGRRVVHRWQAVAGLILIIGITARWRPTRMTHDSPPLAAVPVVTPIVERPSEQSLVMLQKVISENGVDALPAVRLTPSRPLNPDKL